MNNTAVTTESGAHELLRTPLYELHLSLGAKMVPFAGYAMPVQYAMGVLKEHVWTREKAGLFDVSHMGIARLAARDGTFENVARALESLVPADILGLVPGRQRYTQFTNDRGGILDDLMVARPSDADDGSLSLVVNAARKQADYEHLRMSLPADVSLIVENETSLLALQGPLARDVLRSLGDGVANLGFMQVQKTHIAGIWCGITCSGYTGEDGFEISVESSRAAELAARLLENEHVAPIGLGARDSLRLEAGLCLYGHDIDEATSPVEAGLSWSIQQRRRTEGGYPGAAIIANELLTGPQRVRVGIVPDGRAIAREGTNITTLEGEHLGQITSGGFAPTRNGPVAMGYVPSSHASPGQPVNLVIRGTPHPAKIVTLPFVEHRYRRAGRA